MNSKRKREESKSTSSNKHFKPKSDAEKKNFIRACELVSQSAYFNYGERFQLPYTPNCVDIQSCTHLPTKSFVIKEVPMLTAQLMKCEIEANHTYAAIELCIKSITPTQYLSAMMLKEVVEIILNTHEDTCIGNRVNQVIDKCKLVLSLHFTTHCPCVNMNIRKVYTELLTSPMPIQEVTKNYRTTFGSNDGIISFCLRRLEHELEPESSDGPLLDQAKCTPEKFRGTVKGMFYMEKFEIFEMLDRNNRIDRLMEVLTSLIELLQADLAIWQARKNSETKRLRGQLLMVCVLRSKNSEITDVCLQIIKIFSYFIHLDYPEKHIKIMMLWLNVLMETFYFNEICANINFPSPGRSCKGIINQFYDIISELPQKSILRILEWVKPAFIRYNMGLLHSNSLLKTHKTDICSIVINFLKESKWKDFPKDGSDKIVLKTLQEQKIKRKRNLNELLSSEHLSVIWKETETVIENVDVKYPKFCLDSQDQDDEINQRLVINTIYITLQAYIEAYGVQEIQDTLQKLNQDLTEGRSSEEATSSRVNIKSKYAVTGDFIKKYVNMFKMLKEIVSKIKEMESKDNSLEVLKVLKNFITLCTCNLNVEVCKCSR